MPNRHGKGESDPMTLGQALAAQVRLIVWCKGCGRRAEPDVAVQVGQHGAGMPIPDWARPLRRAGCGFAGLDNADIINVISFQVVSTSSGTNIPMSTLQIPNIDDAQLQLVLRLESIFMPYAMKQRAEAYREQTGRALEDTTDADRLRFAHYTSADAAMKIIGSKRIWMRNASCMADYREVQHGFDILQRYFLDKDRTSKFTSALDTCAPGVALEAITLFNQWWGHPSVSTRLNTYITSISLHAAHEDRHGRLSMWRAFGGQNTPRVAFVLSVPRYTGAPLALNLLFSPVAYLTESQVYSVIEEVIENIAANCEFLRSVDRSTVLGIIFSMLLAGVTCLKHEGFHEEREWRAIYSPKRAPSPLMETSIEVVGGLPQPIYKIPLDASVSSALAGLDFVTAFDRLIIGPSPYPWPMYEAFVAALQKSGVSDAAARVFVSEIPIRS